MSRATYTALFLLVLAFTLPTTVCGTTDAYSLSYRDDPATTIVIGWSGDNGTVHYDVVDHGTSHTAYAFTHASDRSASQKGQDRHFARLSGLTPKTVYYFVIYDSNGDVSNRFKFQTLSDNPNDPVSFVSGGDSRQSVEVFGVPVEDCPTSVGCRGERQEGNQLVARLRPDFIAFNGDFVRNSFGIGVEQEWEDWFSDWQMTISPDGRLTPLVLTQGNHEDNTDMERMFDIPTDEYYALDIHGGLLRLYSLNSELNPCTNAQQLNWLQTDLQNNTGTASDPLWKVVQYHVPTYSMGNNYGLESDQMNCWVPEFEQYDVRLVLESHGHLTKWSWPAVRNSAGNDFERNDSLGIVYIGEGQWGAPHRELDYTGSNQKPYIRDQNVADNFFFIQVNSDTIAIRSVLFENVANVSQLNDDNLGSGVAPGASLWNPSNGAVVYLTQSSGMVSVDEPASLQVKRIFPVPSQNYVNIEFGKRVNKATIEVYNSMGKFCKSESFSGRDSYRLDVADLCPGVNFIYVKTSQGVEKHKILKF